MVQSPGCRRARPAGPCRSGPRATSTASATSTSSRRVPLPDHRLRVRVLSPELDRRRRDVSHGHYGTVGAVKYNLSTGDIVYLDGGRPAASSRARSSPRSCRDAGGGPSDARESFGRYYRYTGRVRVLSVQEDTAIAEIVQACDPVIVGTFLQPFEPEPVPLGRRTAMRPVNYPTPAERLAGRADHPLLQDDVGLPRRRPRRLHRPRRRGRRDAGRHLHDLSPEPPRASRRCPRRDRRPLGPRADRRSANHRVALPVFVGDPTRAEVGREQPPAVPRQRSCIGRLRRALWYRHRIVSGCPRKPVLADQNLNGRLYQIVDELVRRGVTLEQARREFERQFIVASLKSNRGNFCRSARSLGVHRNTLRNKVAGPRHPRRGLRPAAALGRARRRETLGLAFRTPSWHRVSL